MVIKAVGKVSKRTGQGRGARTRSHAMRVFAVGQSEEKRNAAENKRQAEGCNKKKKGNGRVCDSKKQLTNTKCKISALFGF